MFGELVLCEFALVVLSASVEESTASESALFVCTPEVITHWPGEWACQLVELNEAPRGGLKFQKRLGKENL